MDASLILFEPLYHERVWGGRKLATLYGRRLPDAATPIGESWEVVDREEAQSFVREGRFAGHSLHDLWSRHREEVFGTASLGWTCERFPILVKILDARDKLSIQVHPPAAVAPQLGGEPKTEMWFIVDAEPGAELYVGLREGVSRERFEEGLASGATAGQVHRISPNPGEFIFIPSGRLHAIGAGLLIFEIQQNSDTTYRVFDWNRAGLDGKPRQLHVAESMRCIDFEDIEPAMTQARGDLLVDCPYFNVRREHIPAGTGATVTQSGQFAIVAVVSGSVTADGSTFHQGDFFAIPACSPIPTTLAAAEAADILVTRLPEAGAG